MPILMLTIAASDTVAMTRLILNAALFTRSLFQLVVPTHNSRVALTLAAWSP